MQDHCYRYIECDLSWVFRNQFTQEELATLINAAGGNSDEQKLNVNSERWMGLIIGNRKIMKSASFQKNNWECLNAELELVDTTEDATCWKDLLQQHTWNDDKQKIPILLEQATPDQSKSVVKVWCWSLKRSYKSRLINIYWLSTLKNQKSRVRNLLLNLI